VFGCLVLHIFHRPSVTPSLPHPLTPHLGDGISPASVIFRHWYGFSEVSRAQASPKVDFPSLPPIATRNRLATRLNVWAYLALGPAPWTSTLCVRGARRGGGQGLQQERGTTREGKEPCPQGCAAPGQSMQGSTHLCHLGRSGSVKSSTCRSSVARPAGPMPPCERQAPAGAS